MSAQAQDPRSRIAQFAGYLRDHGFVLGYAEVVLMTRAAALPLPSWPSLESRWRAIASSSRLLWLKYPELHRAFWFPERVKGTTRTSGLTTRRRTIPELIEQRQAGLTEQPPGAATGPRQPSLEAGAELGEQHESPAAQGGASRTEAMEQRDFTDWSPEDLQRFETIVEAFQRRLRARLLRRWRSATAGGTISVRRSLRRSLATGGELLQLSYVRRRRTPPRVVLLVDVSRSMETYAQFYLRMARTFVDVMRARILVFHTRVADVTPLVTRRSRRVQEKINAVTFGFGGGTRIASCVATAVQQHLPRSLRRRDVLIICSDGYDTDPPGLLAAELGKLRARGVRIVWLHPTRQTPASVTMESAGAVVDCFLPAHNLACLAELGKVLR